MPDLGGFLDSKSSTRKKGSSATVGGNTPEGEIYIRADGKKVRRVKKVVKRQGSERSLNSESLKAAESIKSTKPKAPKRTSSSNSLKDLAGGSGRKGLGSFLGSNASPSASRKSGSATVSGERPTKDGETYIRADGKKVRRVRRETSRSASGSLGDLAKSASSASGGEPKKKKDLGSFLNRESGSVRRSGAKSVSGLSASGGRSVTSKSEVYINKDGKRVRRVKKTSSASVGGDIRQRSSSSASVGGELSSRKPISSTGSSTNLSRSGSPTKPQRTGSSNNLSPVKRTGSSNNLNNLFGLKRSGSSSNLSVSSATQKEEKKKGGIGGALGGFLGKSDRTKKSARSGAASVAGSTPATQGDVYIRADGKKVRRVKKSASSAASLSGKESPSKDTTKDSKKDDKGSSLSGFLGNSETTQPKKSGSATVSGDGRSGSKDGEVYRRSDGKLVRRVKRSVSSSASAAGTINTKSTSNESGGLGSFLSSSPAEKSRMSGAATVTGATGSSKSEQSEVYINKDGKKVRRVKRSVSTSAQNTSGGLSGFMDKQSTSLGPKKLSGSASVSGSTPSTQQGEVYINKDGKKVRRVKRAASAAASLAPTPRSGEKLGRSDGGSILTPTINKQSTKPAVASATVAGDRVLKSDADGEIVIRADGKKVIRRRKGASSSATIAGSQQDGEVYRRADGKLVRRVRKTVTNAGVRGGAAGDLANFMDKTASDKSGKRGGGAATVAGDMPSLSRKAKQAQLTKEEEPEKTGPISQLSPEDEKAAEAYRKMLKMGLPDDAVKHKMIQDAVAPEIMQSVLNREVAAKSSGGDSTVGTAGGSMTVQLSTDEEAIAGRFRKMLKMGLPEDAVRQKMSVEGIDKRIMAAVLGLDVPPESTSQSPPSTTPAVNLSPDEDAIAGRFRKMLKMGLPEDAVKHKMMAEGINSKVISAVVGGPEPAAAAPATAHAASLSQEDESIAARFRKMLKMGLPEDAVKHKMNAEGIDDKIISAVVGGESAEPAAAAPAAASLSADEEAVAARFRKMLKMGLPDDAVRHKMFAEGVNDKIMNAVLGGEPSSGAPAPASAQSTEGSATTASLSAEEEATAERFRKMLKMGLPEDAVKHKMVQENVGPRIIAAVLGGTVPSSQSRSSPVAPAPGAVALSDEDGAAVEKYKKMLKMGMPEDAVKHKMTADGANGKVMSAVLGGGSAPASNGSAFIVVVNDDQKNIPVATAEDIKANPDDKFSVTVGDGSGDASKGNTKLMSLEDIAKATGQNKEDLEKMAKESQAKGQPPKFVLNPVGGASGAEPGKEGMYEVQVPSAPIPEGAKVMDPNKNYAELSAGKEVVDSKLADAARAVSALGDLDMKTLLAKLQAGDMEVLMNKLREAEKRQKKLEKQLAQSGIAIAEDIDYGEAKQKVEEIAKRMGEIGGSDVTVADKEEQIKLREEYFKLEQQMERYNTALMLTEEYQAEQDRLEQKWEDDNAPGNLEALKKIRRHMPVKIRHMSEADLTNNPSPNGKFLPKAIAKKFKRTNVLQCLRMNPDDLERMHPSTLENMRVTGLTLTERRALYCHLKQLGPKWEKNKAEKMTERKWTWYQMMKSNFKENLAPYQRHVEQYGPPENHQGCTLIGKQCPIKANKLIDYDGDYGWTDEAEYEVSDVKKADADDPGAKAMQEALELARAKKANERADLLKKHYKGKLLQVSKANGSCESMDEAMDRMENHTMKWIEFIIDKGDKIVEADKKKEVANFTDAINELKLSSLDFAQRSGMQLSGKKKAGGDGEDIRSSVEAGLADEVWETSIEFFKFIRKRMKENETKDTRVEKTMELIENMLGELHDKNSVLLKKLGVQRPERSRKLKKSEELKKEVEERRKPEEDAPAEEAVGGGGPPGPPRGGGGRGGLLDAISGARGRGPPGRGGGRGGLLGAIAGARGRGRGGGGDKGGRGGLLDAIAGARGRGRGPPSGDSGRGGLLAAIQSRGGGADAGGGGRGGLLAAIQARGGGG